MFFGRTQAFQKIELILISFQIMLGMVQTFETMVTKQMERTSVDGEDTKVEHEDDDIDDDYDGDDHDRHGDDDEQ